VADPRFVEATARVFGLSNEGRLDEALAVIDDIDASIPGHAGRTAIWRACLLAANGRPEESLAALSSGLDRGLWWPPDWLEDEDLDGVRDDPRFGELAARSTAGAERARRSFPDRPEVTIHLPSAETRAVALVLHMLARTVEETEPHWRSAPDLGLAIAFVASTQRTADDEPSWDAEDLVARDLALALEEVRAAGIDPGVPLVLAGASQGGVRAVEATIDPALDARGFVAIVPGTPDLDGGGVRAAVDRGVRGWVLVGAEDPQAGSALRFADELANEGLEVRAESVPALGHDYPADFARRLPGIVDFLLGES
jgi:hypothetical protein